MRAGSAPPTRTPRPFGWCSDGRREPPQTTPDTTLPPGRAAVILRLSSVRQQTTQAMMKKVHIQYTTTSSFVSRMVEMEKVRGRSELQQRRIGNTMKAGRQTAPPGMKGTGVTSSVWFRTTCLDEKADEPLSVSARGTAFLGQPRFPRFSSGVPNHSLALKHYSLSSSRLIQDSKVHNVVHTTSPPCACCGMAKGMKDTHIRQSGDKPVNTAVKHGKEGEGHSNVRTGCPSSRQTSWQASFTE